MPRIRLSRASFMIGFALAMPLMAASPECRQPERRQQVSGWLTMLGDRDPQTRLIARQQLMSLSPADLPLLREVVAGEAHLTPAQADPLEAIVTYVYTRGSLLDQQTDSAKPFLGITLPIPAAEQFEGDDQINDVGVPVTQRLFGYVAYRYLEDGDIILALGHGNALKATHSRNVLFKVMEDFSAGQTITVSLLRGGAVLQLQFALDARPVSANESVAQQAVQASVDRLRDDAQAYWDKEFQQIVDPSA